MSATLDATEAQLVAGLARDVLARTAPGELALFPVTSAAYFRDPSRVTAPRGGGDPALGFGAGTMAALAPVALVISTEAIRWLLGEVRKALQDEGASAVQQVVKRLLGRLSPTPAASAAPGAPIPITAQQYATLRDRLLQRARELGVPPAKAAQMADTAIATLATAGA